MKTAGIVLSALVGTVRSQGILDLFKYDPCSLCGENEAFSLPDVELLPFTAGVIQEPTTCGAVEAKAAEGDYPPPTCAILAMEIGETCGCASTLATEPPTMAPVAATTEPPTDSTTAPAPTEPPRQIQSDQPTSAPAQTLLDIVASSPDHIELAAVATFALVAPALAGPDELTLFAPNDAAFEALYEVTGGRSDDINSTARILLYHVVPGKVLSGDLSSGPVTTALGEDICVVVGEAGVTINGVATVIAADLEALNGVVHVIDGVLLPPSLTGEPFVCDTTASDPPTTAPVMVSDPPTTAPVMVSDPPTSSPVDAVSQPCVICGCPDTDECNDFKVGNPDAVVPIPAEFQDLVPPELGSLTLTCGLLETGAAAGFLPPDLCTQRDNADFRELCGCPPIPTESPVAAPTEAAPTEAPPTEAAPTEAAPTEAEAPASSDSSDDDGLGTGAIVGIIIAVIVAIAVVAICFSQANKNTGDELPRSTVTPTPTEAVPEPKRPPPPPPAPVAAVAAINAAASIKSDGDSTSQAMSSLRQTMQSRVVLAPPGKLGIVIDTTLEGPVVHKVNPGSPMEGALFPGDMIVAVDDTDTRAMNATAITALMVRSAHKKRKLTVLSEDVTN